MGKIFLIADGLDIHSALYKTVLLLSVLKDSVNTLDINNLQK